MLTPAFCPENRTDKDMPFNLLRLSVGLMFPCSDSRQKARRREEGSRLVPTSLSTEIAAAAMPMPTTRTVSMSWGGIAKYVIPQCA